MAKLNIFKKRWGKVGGGRGGLRLARIKNKGCATQCTFVLVTVDMCIFFSFSVSSSKMTEDKKDLHRKKGKNKGAVTYRWILQRLHHKTMFA
jgi:hypothetical protein